MEFIINNATWTIEFKETKELIDLYKTEYDENEVYYVFGITLKPQYKIYINSEMVVEQQIKTLKHELTHCYIWEYGLYNVPNFNEEMACDLVSSSNDFINEVVTRFKEYIKKENKNASKKSKRSDINGEIQEKYTNLVIKQSNKDKLSK